MSDWQLTPTRFEAGVWEAVIEGGPGLPVLEARHDGQLLPAPEVSAAGGKRLVRLSLPAEIISEGVQTVIVSEAGSGIALATITLIAGEALAHDIRAELDLLRAELDLLKRAFRRHVAEGA